MIIKGMQLGLQQQIRKTNDSLQKSTGKLSSGKRITSASVDATGLAISEKLRALQRGSQQALRNVQDAHSLVQTADSAMQELTDVVQRIRELTIQAMNGTNTYVYGSGSNADTILIQNEIDALKRNLGEIVGNTEFNTKKLLTNKEPGEYLIADRQVTANFPAKSVGSTNAVISGANDNKTDSVGYTKEVVVASSTIPVSQTPVIYEPIAVNMSTVVDHLPKWSADGSSILFTSSRDGGTYRVGINGVTDPIGDAGTASAPFKTTARNYRLTANGSSLELQKNDGYSWRIEKSFSYLSSDGNTGFSFSPSIDEAGNTSFVFSDGLGNLSKVDLNVYSGEIDPEIPLISTTDRLNLPPQNNTLSLSRTPDLYRMNGPEASLVIKKVTDSGERVLTYWDGMGSEPADSYYTVTNNRVTFHGNAIIGNEPLDDAQDYYTFQYVGGTGSSSFHTESIPSGAQLYNVHGEDGPISLKVTLGNRVVQRNEFLTERPVDVENTTGLYVDEVSGKIEFYGDLRPSSVQNVDIHYMSDSDSDRTVQTYNLPSTIDTYNLENDDQSAPRSLKVYIGGREVAYDPTKTNGYTYDPATRRISIYGDSRPDITNGDQLSIRYIADKSMTQTSPDVYGIPLGTPKPEIFNLGMEGVPNSIRVYRGSEEIAFSGTNGFLYNEQTNTIELYGDSRPNVGEEYRVIMIAVTADPIKHDDKLEIPLSGRPEIYGVADPDIPSTLKVTINGKEISYDPNKQNGYYYNSNTNRIEIFGNQLPDANEVASSPVISVQFVKEGIGVTLGNRAYDIQLARGASSYGIDGNGTVKGMKVYRGAEEVPYDDENGFTYDEATGILTLHGTYRPTSDDAAGLYRVVSVPEQVLMAAVPNGSTVHKVYMNNTEVQRADSEHPNGYIYENGKVQLIGDGRPDTTKGISFYQLIAIYTDPLSISLPVDPLSTATTGYCEHETGSALPNAELVPGSLTVRLNNVELNSEQYRIEGNRVLLISDDLPVNAGNNTLTADYQIRQGIDYKENSFTFQVGGNSGNQKIVNIASFDNMLQNISAVCVRTADHSEKGLEIIDQSMKFILSELGNIGAAENSFDHISANLKVTEEALTSALSRIEDVDMAKEIMNSTKLQILSQAQQALAGQGRQMQESVLKLLQ